MFSVFTREKDEKACGERIESAGVANFDFVAKVVAKLTSDASDYTEARDASGLIDENDLVR